MPRRSDPFQTLVAQIQHHLAEQTDVEVEESKMLTHAATGEPREVDIVVEGKVGGIDVLIAFEICRGSRTAGSEWVERMLGKHDNLPSHRLILVSESGFAKPAKVAVDARSDVEAITLSDASEVDWGEYAKHLVDLRFGAFQSTPIAMQVRWTDEVGLPEGVNLNDVTFRRLQDGLEVKAFDIALAYLHDKRFKKTVNDEYFKVKTAGDLKGAEKDTINASGTIDCTFSWEEHEREWSVEVSDRVLHVQSISIKAQIDIKDSSLSLSYQTFMGQNVAHGLVEDPFADPSRAPGGELSVALTQTGGEKPIASVSFTDHPESGKKTFIVEPGDLYFDFE